MPKQTVSLWLDSEIVNRIDNVRGVSSRSIVMNEFLKERILEQNPTVEKNGEMP